MSTQLTPPEVPPQSDGQPPRDDGSNSDAITSRELKLTAALYASREFVWRHVRDHGTLPPNMKPLGGATIGMRLLIERRGIDITLTAREQKVLAAIRREGRLPGGAVVLVDQDGAEEKQP